LDFDGSCWMGGLNNQPKSGPIIRIYLDGAQGDGDRGGHHEVFLAIGFGAKKLSEGSQVGR
jgi:hypothetical protein